MILAGDIGGTKTHLALFEEGKERDWAANAKFRSKDYPNLNEIVKAFLAENPGHEVVRAGFGIAGPIEERRRCRATNLPWVIDADEMEKDLQIGSVYLLNDLEANGYGINCLTEEEFFILNEGEEKTGNKALISAGTGLGEAGLFWNGKHHIPFGSEGGHASFAPDNEEEVQLLQFLKRRFGHVSLERILSGPGFKNIYDFLIVEGIETESEKAKEAFKTKAAPVVITELGLENSCKACVATLDRFAKIYGGEAGNWALKMLAMGGVYLGGGIAPKIKEVLKEKGFIKRFKEKGRFAQLLSEMPVKVILNENTALIGAGYYVRKNGEY